MSLYKVKSNLEHNGVSYHPGDEVDLDEKSAAILLKDGIVEDVSGASAGPEKQSDEQPSQPASDTTSQPQNDPPAGDPTALENLPYAQLQERAKALGLKYSGISKPDLIESIKTAEASAQAGTTDGDKGKQEGETNQDGTEDLEEDNL